MQFKTKLLSGVFASAVILGITGPANAIIVNASVSGTPLGDTVTTPANAMIFASEVASSDGSGNTSTNARDNGVATLGFEVATGTYPSGNVIIQLQLNGGTFRGALTASVFDWTGCTVAPSASVSIGGANATNTVTYVVSGLNGCNPGDEPLVSIPFDLNSSTSDLDLVMTILTESGNVPVDATNALVVPLVRQAKAFTVEFADNGDVIANVQDASGPYLGFVAGSTPPLGSVDVDVDATTVVDFNGAGPVVLASNANVNQATLTLSGNFAPFRVVNGGAADVGGYALTLNSSFQQATRVFSAGAQVNALIGGPLDVNVVEDGETAITTSNYGASLVTDLVTGFTDFTETGALSPITRNGTFATLPWTASNTQAGGTGSNTFVRVSNPTTSTYGPVTATVLTSTVAGMVGETATLVASVAPGSEVLFTAAQLETALGNFGRGDIEIAVEGNDSIIKRLIQRTDGTYEINNVRER